MEVSAQATMLASIVRNQPGVVDKIRTKMREAILSKYPHATNLTEQRELVPQILDEDYNVLFDKPVYEFTFTADVEQDGE